MEFMIQAFNVSRSALLGLRFRMNLTKRREVNKTSYYSKSKALARLSSFYERGR